MHRHDQRTQLFLVKVLDLINEDRDSTLTILGRFTDRGEEIGQISLQITAVGGSLFRFNIEPNADVVDRQLQASDEASEDGEAPLDLVAGAGDPIQLIK